MFLLVGLVYVQFYCYKAKPMTAFAVWWACWIDHLFLQFVRRSRSWSPCSRTTLVSERREGRLRRRRINTLVSPQKHLLSATVSFSSISSALLGALLDFKLWYCRSENKKKIRYLEVEIAESDHNNQWLRLHDSWDSCAWRVCANSSQPTWFCHCVSSSDSLLFICSSYCCLPLGDRYDSDPRTFDEEAAVRSAKTTEYHDDSGSDGETRYVHSFALPKIKLISRIPIEIFSPFLSQKKVETVYLGASNHRLWLVCEKGYPLSTSSYFEVHGTQTHMLLFIFQANTSFPFIHHVQCGGVIVYLYY